MNNADWENNFNKEFKYLTIYAPIFIGVLIILIVFRLYERLNNHPILTLVFFLLLSAPIFKLFYNHFKTRNALNENLKSQIEKAKITINIDINYHPLYKLDITRMFRLTNQVAYYINEETIIASFKTINENVTSQMYWSDFFQSFIRMEFNERYLTVILYRKFLNNKETPFRPFFDMNISSDPENIMIPVNSKEEATKVMEFIQTLLDRYLRNNNQLISH